MAMTESEKLLLVYAMMKATGFTEVRLRPEDLTPNLRNPSTITVCRDVVTDEWVCKLVVPTAVIEGTVGTGATSVAHPLPQWRSNQA